MLGPARSKADRQLVPAGVVLGGDGHPCGGGAEPNDVALVGGPARSARAAKIHGLEKIRLARSVWTPHDRQARAKVDASLAVSAEITQGDAEHPHRIATRSGESA